MNIATAKKIKRWEAKYNPGFGREKSMPDLDEYMKDKRAMLKVADALGLLAECEAAHKEGMRLGSWFFANSQVYSVLKRNALNGALSYDWAGI